MSAEARVDAGLVRAMPLPPVRADADKEARGRVLVAAGSREMPGAVLLTGIAALRAGAGKLQLAVAASTAVAVGVAAPEARVFAVPETPEGDLDPAAADVLAEHAGRCDAVVLGPGASEPEAAAALTARLLAACEGASIVVDAAAMSGLRQAGVARRHAGRLVLTPHAGEMAALTGAAKAEVEADRALYARRVAAELQAVVALKGRETIVATPAGLCWRHSVDVPGLAVSGSGDVLAGVIGGLLARGAAPAQAAVWGVFLHAQAGLRLARALGPLGLLARELPGEIPALLAEYGAEP